ncbi:MAG: hypothetical protein ACOVP8_04490, partial [Phycisphaerales bacterium]
SIILRRSAKARQPFEFARSEIALFLAERGITTGDDPQPASSPVIPRELARKHVRVLETIGQGEFATVHKGLLNEKATTGIPEYTVAIKVCCWAVDGGGVFVRLIVFEIRCRS